MEEIYLPVKGHECYEVSNKGNVRNRNTNRMLKRGVTQSGLVQVVLDYKSLSVHKLVMDAFDPEYDKKYTDIKHLDGDKSNCELSNLKRCLHSDNLNRKTNSERISNVRYINRMLKTTIGKMSDEEIKYLKDNITEDGILYCTIR